MWAVLLVAMESVPEGFSPHSLHSYFVKAGDDSIPCQYEVEKISDGNNFANRLIRVVQNDEIKYLVMISLTKKNSFKDAVSKYQQQQQQQLQQQHSAGGKKLAQPLDFQVPPPRQFSRYHPDDLQTRDDHDHSKVLQHKFVPEFYNSQISERDELAKTAAERDLSFWIRIDDKLQSGDQIAQKQQKFKYAGFGVILDSLYLTSLSRLLHLPIKKTLTSGGKGSTSFPCLLTTAYIFMTMNLIQQNGAFSISKLQDFLTIEYSFREVIITKTGNYLLALFKKD